MSPIWERQPEESTPAWEAFAVYRDHPDRSLVAVARELGKSASLVARWSARWSWVQRAAAWDAEADRAHRSSLQRRRRAAALRHLELAEAGMGVVRREIGELLTRDPGGLRPADVGRFLDTCARLEKEALGGFGTAEDPETTPSTSTTAKREMALAYLDELAAAEERVQRAQALLTYRTTTNDRGGSCGAGS
ncbi:MAG: hypothetical protein JWO98_170 [Frankiales bacterium]|nr:hypothetical protein [Frankiales bacterium]